MKLQDLTLEELEALLEAKKQDIQDQKNRKEKFDRLGKIRDHVHGLILCVASNEARLESIQDKIKLLKRDLKRTHKQYVESIARRDRGKKVLAELEVQDILTEDQLREAFTGLIKERVTLKQGE